MKKLREFKLCNKCNKELSFNKFRERKDTGWKDINNKFRYSYCRECEKKRFKEAYKKDPIPQMLSNSKIRAKAKNYLIILPLMILEKSGRKIIYVLF